MKNTNKLISILVVNYNGKKWLKKCLTSLLKQTYQYFEIIFVDNGSIDGSVEYVRLNYPLIKVVISDKNLGFANGNILGLNYAHGDFILLLNNDTCAKKNYLANLIEAFKVVPNLGSVQSKMILMKKPNTIDVCGAYWTDSSFLYHYGWRQNQSRQKYNTAMSFFSNKGASMMIKKSVIDKVGFLDGDFWSYYEETDLCNRIWLAGYECWYYPKAVIQHFDGGTALTFSNSYIQFHNFKNKLLSFLKNFELSTLIKILPIYLLINIMLSFFWLFQGKWKHFFALYQSIWWNIKHFHQTMIKRKKIQALRKKTDKEIFKQVKRNPGLSYYFFLLTRINKYAK